MDRQTFEHLVSQALNELPQEFQSRLDNVEVVVEDWADRGTLRQAGVRHPAMLLGFYHGVPQTKRTTAPATTTTIDSTAMARLVG